MALTKVSRGLLSTSIEDNGNATAITIDSSENVGIGTSSPISKMQVSGANNGDVFYLTSSDVEDDRGLIFSNSSNGLIWDLDAKGASSSFGQMTFSTNGSERMRIDSSGNVGIGTTSPTFKLDVAGNARANYFALRANESAPSESAFVYRPATGVLGFGTSSAERMRIDSSGNLLVGTTSWTTGGGGLRVTPSGRSDFSRNTTSSTQAINFANPNGFVGNITLAGSTTTYNTSSDQRLKDNIVDAPSASEDIDAIQVRSFDWKADGSHQKYGMVAQELQTVAPEAVSVPEDSEEMMGVDYSKLVPMLIKEIQSLRNRVAQLEE